MASDSDDDHDDKRMLSKDEDAKKYPDVPREVFIDWLIAVKNIVLPVDPSEVPDDEGLSPASGEASPAPQNEEASSTTELKNFAAVLAMTENMSEIDVEAFIRFYEFDVSYRFDLRFCEYQKRMAIDTLMLFAYIPFVFLFAYFLVQGRGLGSGYYMNANIVDFFLGQEFDVSDDLRFVKTYWDIGSDGEFWEFVSGPLIGGLWAGDGPEETVNATQLVQQTLMPIGALKIRQKRVEGEICTTKQRSMFSNNVEQYTTTQEGVDYIRSRQRDFNAFCYPELDYLNDNTEKGAYPLIRELHDGVDRFSMDSTELPSQVGKLPPVFVETMYLTEDMIVEDDKFMFPAFQYQSCDNLNGSDSSWVRGKLGRYHCDGHGIVFPFSWSLEKVNKAVDVLMNGITAEYIDPHTGYLTQKRIPWIDSQTRAITFDIMFFSKDIELFTFSQFLVEVTATGCWIPVKSLRSFELFLWDAHSHAYFFFVFLYVAYICWYWVIWIYNYIQSVITINAGSKNALDIISSIFRALKNFWVVFDLINLVLFLIALILTMRTWVRGITDQSILQTEFYPTDYEDISIEAELASYISAANGLLTFCRIFYFLQMHPQLNLLTKTVHKAANDLVGIVIIFIIVFTAFSLVTYVIYGLQLEDFRSFQQTIISLCRMLIGDFNYEELMNERRIMTPVIFSMYNALAVFILLNMVIAILDEAFSKVQQEKYVPRKLLSLMNSSDDQEFEYAGDYVERSVVWDILFNNPPVKEFLYWWRRLHLELLVLSGHERDSREWREKLHEVRRSNPRVYWSMRVSQIRKNMKTYAFKDKCRLIPRELDYILMDQLGEDFVLLRDNLLWKPARAMHRSPQRLLENILQFHHLWQINVEAVTQTGKTLKLMKEVQEKKYVSIMFTTRPQFPFTMFYTTIINFPLKKQERRKASTDVLETTGEEQSRIQTGHLQETETQIRT
eukprot:TRINITY_DN6607_c0_g2_i1.p1 TRINITY_DN6607_c0_g2~~TRINITY_DN6607_c0_g2_i1.p1  ORF type:complete len:1005 (+),score=159.35 TRINITY_DN6607_c0_g2_i1:162-3017(+)